MIGYFGTDGIRGRAGEGKLSAFSLEKMAQAIGAFFGPNTRAVIGRDTRESGDWIQDALIRGLTSQGVSIVPLGILPTPGTASMCSHLNADFGLMITASHNPYHDNGVKLFGADGRKISDQDQDAIEALIQTALHDEIRPVIPAGTVEPEIDHSQTYIEALCDAFRSVGGHDLTGLKIVADCAHGAAFETFPATLRALGADPVLLGITPDGQNINANCGSTHTEGLAKAVLETKADIGVALDGDADRLIMIDNCGEDVDGDQLIARLAKDWKSSDMLATDRVVTTVMSNLGLERYLETLGLTLDRTPVGDRHVAARMVETGANLGGEPSGHLLMTDHAVTGDGSLAALMILSGLVSSEQSAADYLTVFNPMPQLMKNVRYSGQSPLHQAVVQEAIKASDQTLGTEGRVLVRASGTEPLIRVMAEGNDPALVSETVEELCEIIASATN